MEQCLDLLVLWPPSQAQQKDPERIWWDYPCPSCDHDVQAKHSQFHLTLQDCICWGLDPIEQSSEDLPKDLTSQLILKAPPAPVLMGMKEPKPEVLSCKREYGSFSCEFTLGKGQRSSAGGFIQHQWRQIVSFPCFCKPRTRLCSLEAQVTFEGAKNYFPDKVTQENKNHPDPSPSTCLLLPPPQISLHATSSYASLTKPLHWIFGFLHIWVGRFSLTLVSKSTGNALKPCQGEKKLHHTLHHAAARRRCTSFLQEIWLKSLFLSCFLHLSRNSLRLTVKWCLNWLRTSCR